ncbi:MAG: SPOR domain-containing protein [Thermodesulfobacteriota bacterium]
MKANIKIILVGALFLLAALAISSSGQENQPDDSATKKSDPSSGSGFTRSLNSNELDRETAAGLKKDMTSDELNNASGAGLKKDMTSDELNQTTGAGIKHVTSLELSMSSGRGFGSDLSLTELENMVGYGFINKLTPDEIDKINARGTLSDEQARLTVKDLAAINAQGVKFIIDTSKFSPEEMGEIEGRGTLQDIGKYPYSIQVGIFRDKENAIAMLESVKARGYDPYIFRTRDELGNAIFAVRLGDYETVQEAYAEVTHYMGKEHKEAFVTYINSTQSIQREDLINEEEDFVHSGKEEKVDLDKEYASEDLRTLYKQIQSLQGEVEKLRTESEARKKLKMTEAEQQQEEEEILSAAGREYVLSPARTLSFDYSFGYSHNSFDEAEWNAQRIIHTADHTLTNTISAAYALYDNLTLATSIPFKYKYNDMGASGSKDVSDIGDVSFSGSWQPTKSDQKIPPLILSASVAAPTGRGPYEINPEIDLSTGAGLYSLSMGVNTNKKIDPVVAYGGLAYSYQFKDSGLNYYLGDGRVLDEVEPGSGLGMSLGMGYAMSYAATINASFSLSYAFGTKYHYEDGESSETDDTVTASLSLGTGWRFSAKRTISFNVGLGLTNDASDFSFAFRIPFDYQL